MTLAAACMQVTRTALQKRISRDLNDWAVTWIRYGFAMPVDCRALAGNDLCGCLAANESKIFAF